MAPQVGRLHAHAPGSESELIPAARKVQTRLLWSLEIKRCRPEGIQIEPGPA
jgi:hypothetical protein